MIIICHEHGLAYELILGGPGCPACHANVELKKQQERSERLAKAFQDIDLPKIGPEDLKGEKGELKK